MSSAVAEVAGDLKKAIRYRQREIETLRKLSQSDVPELARVKHEEVSDSLDLLAIHYWDLGNLPKALKILEQSKRYCEEHGIPFDGQDIVDEVRSEITSVPSRNGAVSHGSGKRSY